MRHPAFSKLLLLSGVLSGLLSGCFNSSAYHYNDDGGNLPVDAISGRDSGTTGGKGSAGEGTGGASAAGGKAGSGSGGAVDTGGGKGGNGGSAGVVGTGGVVNMGGAKTGGAGGISTGGISTGGTGGTATGGAGGMAAGGQPGTGGLATGGGGTGGSPACQGTATQCSGAKIQACVSGQWAPPTDCPAHQACSGPPGTARCTCSVDAACKAPANTCSTPSTLITCMQDANGCVYQSGSMDCGTHQPSQYCSGGQCISKIGDNSGGCNTNIACSSGNCSTSPTAGTMCCAAKLANCSQGCYDLSADTKHCGTCAKVCDANNACVSSKCQCAGGSNLSCGTCPSWNFESNSTEGWVDNSADPSSVVTPVAKPTPSGSPFSGSTYSLAIPVNLVGQGQAGTTAAAVRVPLCATPGTSADVTGFSFYLYMDGPDYTPGKDIASMNASNQVLMSPVSKQWILVSTTSPTASASDLQIRFNPMAAWSGTIYIDQVQIAQ